MLTICCWTWQLLGVLDQTVVHGIKRKLKAVGDTELIEDVVEVVLHGLFTDEELFANLLVAVPLRDKLDNLLLTVAQQRFVSSCPAVRMARRELPESASSRTAFQSRIWSASCAKSSRVAPASHIFLGGMWFIGKSPGAAE